MSDSDLTFGVTVERVDAALRDIGRVEQANASAARGTQQAAQTMSRSASTASSSIASLGQTATQAGQAVGRGVGALGAFTTSLGSISPAARTAGAVISQLGGAVGALSGAMGPFGVALGVATIALNVYQAVTASSAEASANAEDATRRHREEVDRLGSSARTAAQQLADLQQSIANRDAEARLGRIARGDVQSEDEARLAAERLRRLAAIGERRGGTAAEIFGGAEEDAARMEARAAELASGPSGSSPPRRGGGGSRRASTPLENTTDNGAAIARYAAEQELELVKAYEERARAEAELEAAATARAEAESEKNEIQKEAERERLAALRELEQAAIESSDTFRDSWRGSIDDVVDSWREANRAIRASNGQMMGSAALLEMSMRSAGNSIADTIGGTMVNAFENALGAWLDGSKSFVEAAEDMVKGVLKALVIESIVQAVTETARGIASFASQDYAGGAMHLAAAAAWAAVGGVAGAVGAGIGAFGGGGDKSGASAGAATVTPTDASSSQGQQQPTVINVYPGGYITRRDVEDGIVDALNSAAREGRRLDPALVGV